MMNRFQTALKRFKDSHEEYLKWNKAQLSNTPKKPISKRSLELHAIFEAQGRDATIKSLNRGK